MPDGPSPLTPVPPEADRPLWSVMIPTYNPGPHLQTALESVLSQDPGPAAMQIAIVDDASTTDSPEALVERLGATDRVEIHHHVVNVGATKNFNTCLNLARGHWIHLLHADDFVLEGFYRALSEPCLRDREIGAACARYLTVDEDGHWVAVSPLERRTSGVLDTGWVQELFRFNRLECAAVVVRRETVEALGGFDERLVHSADWDLWRRIGANLPIWHEVTPLAAHRRHLEADTSRLCRSGENIRDIRRSIALAARYLDEPLATSISKQARRRLAYFALRTAVRAAEQADWTTARNQLREAFRCRPGMTTARWVVQTILRHPSVMLERGGERTAERPPGS